MKVTLFTLTAACATLSLAQAIPAPRPYEGAAKYYFPRVVKRQETTTANSTSPTDTGSSSSSTSSAGGLLDGLGNIVGSALDPAAGEDGTAVGEPLSITTSTADSFTVRTPSDSASPDATTPPAAAAEATTSRGGLLDTLTDIVNTVTSRLDADSTSPALATTTPGRPTDDDLVGPPSITPTTDAGFTGPGTDVPQTTSKTGLLDGVIGGVTSALSDIGDGLPTTTPRLTQTPDIPDGPTPTPILTPTTSRGGLLDTISDIVSSAGDQLTNLPPVTSTRDFPTTQPPQPTDDTRGPTNPPTTAPPPPPQSTTGQPTPDDQPTPPPQSTSKGPEFTPPPQTTAPPPPPPANNATEPEPQPPTTPAFTPPPVVESSTQPPEVKPTPPISIEPTGRDNATAVVPPTNIQTAPPATTASNTNNAPSTAATVMPSNVPRVITPEGGVPVAPENSTLIQIAFKEELHYEFVVGSQLAVSQIFTYLPVGVTDGLGVNENKMVMQYLQPYNTLASLHYITTLAMAYIPTSDVDKLAAELITGNSALYTNPDKSVNTLMKMIDPSVPLLAGQGLTPGGTLVNTQDNGNSGSGSDGEGDAPGGGEGGSSGVKPSSVGIAVGAVAGAAVYGAAMFLVARRYKKRKAAHQRASSVQTDETPRPGENTNLMTGARNSYGSRVPGRMNSYNGRGSRNSDRSDDTNRSGRTYISPPVMAENSLGWN